jgi:murein DD-endopeptidase MepM/ murein hydrolase activator NlpD
VLAPADGVVVRTRDDIPDDMEPSVYLALDDPLYAIGGNGVVLKHDNHEYSMLFHLRHGSIRVRPHDRVRQGDVLGVVGSAGTPGYVHLHYHLQAGPDFLAADGLPVQFDNVVMASDWLGPYRRGISVPTPVRGPYLTTTGN